MDSFCGGIKEWRKEKKGNFHFFHSASTGRENRGLSKSIVTHHLSPYLFFVFCFFILKSRESEKRVPLLIFLRGVNWGGRGGRMGLGSGPGRGGGVFLFFTWSLPRVVQSLQLTNRTSKAEVLWRIMFFSFFYFCFPSCSGFLITGFSVFLGFCSVFLKGNRALKLFTTTSCYITGVFFSTNWFL